MTDHIECPYTGLVRFEEATAGLRFIQRGNARLLQQLWRITWAKNHVVDSVEQEWRDVPTVCE